MASILVIEDEEAILNVLEAYLKADGHTVHRAQDGLQGLSIFRRHQPDLVILDIMLPSMDGLEVLQNIRRESNAYVILLTAKSEEIDRIVGLSVGADDYVTKPFSPRELLLRIKAILRRTRGQAEENTVMVFEHLRIDSHRHEISRDGESIEMTALELKLLRTLASYPGMVFSREQLLEKVWGFDYFGEDRVVDVHIGHIRQKLEYDLSNPQFILTVRGVGYKFGDKIS